jgi:hypothetical protein
VTPEETLGGDRELQVWVAAGRRYGETYINRLAKVGQRRAAFKQSPNKRKRRAYDITAEWWNLAPSSAKPSIIFVI